LGLPVIVVYPEYSDKSDIVNCKSKTIKQQIKNLWDNLPYFRNSLDKVAPRVSLPWTMWQRAIPIPGIFYVIVS